VEAPKGLHTELPLGKWWSTFQKVRAAHPWREGTSEYAENQGLYVLSLLFQTPARVEKWVSSFQGDMHEAAMGMHRDYIVEFSEPGEIKAWADFCYKHPPARQLIAHWKRVSEELGRLPRSLTELRRVAQEVMYTDVRRPDVAGLAARCMLSQADFEKYQDFMDEPGKTWEGVPHFEVTGEEVGLEGDWRLRRLDSEDPMGPMLGETALTCCCQHLGGWADGCARAGRQEPTAAFIVAEYKGEVVAQSFVWVSAGGTLCIDNIEGKKGVYIEGVWRLYEGMVPKVLGRLGIKNVSIGITDYGITPDVYPKVEGAGGRHPVLQEVPQFPLGYYDAQDGQYWVAGEEDR
jgi:hypothetical protein